MTNTPPPTNGKIRPISRWGTPILHRAVREVAPADLDTLDLEALTADMFTTMFAADGVGLAANQIGVDLKVFVYDLTDLKGQRSWGVVCNPVVETRDGPREGRRHHAKGEQHQHQQQQQQHQQQSMTEGCLSYPGVSASVARARAITVRGIDQRGKAVEIDADGLLAHILQHETDHLNGVVYGDHVSSEVRQRMDTEYKELESKPAYPEDWPVTRTKRRWII
ncbi:polypeptide deformylase [Cladophialophora yegresii CBS 114405]|uniref:Peptide deformylase n=1 Tax=Cladophialophora yegresii CBS 114405 TaxID=1182544 RepID=W9VV19_9EURO|nr:polypeptide deformylase [Cladophialophora yegresii CBS 114405]EXJ59592.1 polypeptide deformylase [Cladophialophora yegresii CBS 114405]